MAAEIRLIRTDDGNLQMALGGDARSNQLIALGMLERAKFLVVDPPQQAEERPSLLVARGSLPALSNGG